MNTWLQIQLHREAQTALQADIDAVTHNDMPEDIGRQVNPEDIPQIAWRHAVRVLRARARYYRTEKFDRLNAADLDEAADAIEIQEGTV